MQFVTVQQLGQRRRLSAVYLHLDILRSIQERKLRIRAAQATALFTHHGLHIIMHKRSDLLLRLACLHRLGAGDHRTVDDSLDLGLFGQCHLHIDRDARDAQDRQDGECGDDRDIRAGVPAETAGKTVVRATAHIIRLVNDHSDRSQRRR